MIYQFSIQNFTFLLFHPHENQVQMMRWHLYYKGQFTNYVDKFLDFDHLPPFVYTFYLIKVDIFDYLSTSSRRRYMAYCKHQIEKVNL